MKGAGLAERVAGAALGLGSLALVGASALYTAAGSHLDSSPAGSLQVVAFALLAVGFGGVEWSRLFRAPGSLVGLIGVAGSVGGAAIGTERIYTGAGFPRLETVPGGPVAYALGLLFPLSLAGLAAVRGRADPAGSLRWLPLALGALLFPASRLLGWPLLGLVADLMIAGGLVPTGLDVARGRRPPPPNEPGPSG